MARRASLGELEQLVLLAILQLGRDATGVRLLDKLEADAERRVSRGTLYAALSRLEDRGYLSWTVRDSSEDRGGHPSRVFAVTETGLEVVRQQQRILKNLTVGLSEILGVVDA